MKSENITRSWIVCHKHTLQEAHFLAVLAVSPVDFSALVQGFITLSTSSTHTNLNKLSLPLKRSLKTKIQKKSSAVCGSYTASSPNNRFTFKMLFIFSSFYCFYHLKKDSRRTNFESLLFLLFQILHHNLSNFHHIQTGLN